MTPIPEWATHLAVDPSGRVWAYEEEPYFSTNAAATGKDEWAPADDGDGLRCALVHEPDPPSENELIPSEVARLLCVRIPRPGGWEPPALEEWHDGGWALCGGCEAIASGIPSDGTQFTTEGLGYLRNLGWEYDGISWRCSACRKDGGNFSLVGGE